MQYNTIPSIKEEPKSGFRLTDVLFSLGTFQIVLLALFAGCTTYGPAMDAFRYGFYSDVSIMMFVGFGYLMTFLKKAGYTAVAYTMMITVVVGQWAMLTQGFFAQIGSSGHIVNGGSLQPIPIDVASMIQGMFAAAAVLISFGGVIGVVSLEQMAVMAIVEVVFYSLNNWLCTVVLQSFDMGGSVVIHTFGAYFGLSVSLMVTSSSHPHTYSSWDADNSSNTVSDILSMIGTVFLWIYWPSFNGAAAPCDNPASGCGVLFTTVNTFMSLCASCTMVFFWSSVLRERKFNMVDIQNATLAGGVAIGTASDLAIHPAGAIAVGIVAGTLSNLGYRFIQPYLQSCALKLHDTCGIHNLHGMPGLLGGFVGVIASVFVSNPPVYVTHFAWQRQLAALLITFVLAVGSGSVVGWGLSKMHQEAGPCYNDARYFSVPADSAFTHTDLINDIRADMRSSK